MDLIHARDYPQPRVPNETAYRVLIVDDDLAQAEMVREFLHISGFKGVERAANMREFWEKMGIEADETKEMPASAKIAPRSDGVYPAEKDHPYDIILLDYRLPDGNGLQLLEQLTRRKLQIPVIMITGQGNEQIAAQAIQHGASDYLLKSGDYLITLPALIQKSIQAQRLKSSIQKSLEQIRYQALLLKNVGDAIVVWDLAGRITYWNPAATSLFGVGPDERIGQPAAQVYLPCFNPPITLPDDSGRATERIMGRTESSTHVVRKFIGCTGSTSGANFTQAAIKNIAAKTIWVSSRLTALRDERKNNRLIGYMDVTHDISHSVEAEQALRESEARYRAIVEDYQTELICRFKPNGTLTFVNQVYCRYFGLEREQLLGMNFLYFVPESERAKLIQHLVSFGPNKTVATLDHQVALPNQGLRWIQRTDRAIFDTRGRIFEFQSVGRDITANKMMEVQVRAAQAHLIQAARMATIGEVASGVAHQIYNPLTTIIADAQILLRALPVDQPGRDSAEAIEQAGWRLQQVVQRLMEFSRPAEEGGEAHFEPVSVAATIRTAVSLVAANLETAGFRVELSLDDQLPAIQGNRGQLEALWVNLLLLARDAGEPGSSHHIHITTRGGSGTLDKHTSIVEICDDGAPIPADQLPGIFEPNFVAAPSGRGSGMEFSICREIVRQHGGQIVAESFSGIPDGETTQPQATRPKTVFRITFSGRLDDGIEVGSTNLDDTRPSGVWTE